MAKNRTLGQKIAKQVSEARRTARDAVENARRNGETRHISVAGRTNIVAQINTGNDGAVSVATGQEESPIVQGADQRATDIPRSGT
jgi:hypothetical protein